MAENYTTGYTDDHAKAGLETEFPAIGDVAESVP